MKNFLTSRPGAGLLLRHGLNTPALGFWNRTAEFHVARLSL